VLWFYREVLSLPAPAGQAGRGGGAGRRPGFLRIPAVWMCFAFFCSMPWR
jgi:hypothetical protein